MSRVMKILMAVMLIVVLLVTGCKEQAAEAVDTVIILGDPIYAADFATSGEFSLSVIPLTDDGIVIELENPSQVSFTEDSVAKVTYNISVLDIDFVAPSADKVAVGLLLDSSGSMSWNDPSDLRISASKGFIRKLLDNNTANRASVADFGASSNYYFRLLQAYTNVGDTVSLFSALDSVTASGGTPLYTGIHNDLEYTDTTVSASQFDRVLLALTDGMDNASHPEDTLGAIINISNQKDIPVYVIGLGSSVNVYDLKRLANNTGGVYAHADSAGALTKIFNAMGLGLSQGYNNLEAKFDPIPSGGAKIYTRVTIEAGGSTASAILIFDIP